MTGIKEGAWHWNQVKTGTQRKISLLEQKWKTPAY